MAHDSTFQTPRPSAARPLLGLTVLVIEDSRFASEAVRLLCLRSGARIRRADSLAAARKHLRVYRPSAVIVDLGLPDGSGLELIADLSRAQPRVDVLLGLSGDDGAERLARAAGADGFLPKPIPSLAVFQETLLALLPAEARPRGPRLVRDEVMPPDDMALQDDLAHAADILTTARGDDMLDYIAQFLTALAHASGDEEMGEAAGDLAARRSTGAPVTTGVARVAGLIQTRLARQAGG